MVPEKRQRPLSLMHVCKECALFSVRKQQPNSNSKNEFLQQTLLVTPPFCSTDSDLSSSPFSSPASSVDSSPETSSGLPSPKAGHIRHRSNSECFSNTSPVKSILKRRPMFRSLSVCEEDNYEKLKYYDNSLDDVSESSNQLDEDSLAQSLNGFKKKSVSFSERVEQNFFRPNSSILGQKKKNQRKSKGRKRRASTDSIASSENEDDNHKNFNSNNSTKETSVQIPLPDNSVQNERVENHSDTAIPEQVIQSADQTTNGDQQSKSPKKSGKEAKTSKKKPKDKKHANVIITDDRYKGFVIGVQRRASSDSALSLSTDDDDENSNNNVFDCRRNNATCESKLLAYKDSGIDDDMEELCAQMTAAVVSA